MDQLTRQKDFCEKHGIKPAEIVEFRQKVGLVENADFSKQGVTIYWTRGAVAKAEAFLAGDPPPEPEEAQPEDDTFTVHINGLLRNDNYVHAAHEGKRIVIYAGRKWSRRIVGKPARVRRVVEEGQTLYQYLP